MNCSGAHGVHSINGCFFKEVEGGDSVFKAVDHFCCLDDMLSAVGGFEAAAIACESQPGVSFRRICLYSLPVRFPL